MCLPRIKVTLKNTIKSICCVYRSPNGKSFCEIFKLLQLSAKIISNFPPFQVFGDFNVHSKEWLGSKRTRAAEILAVCYDKYHLWGHISNALINSPNTLDQYPTTNPDPYTTGVDAPLGRLNHALITMQQFQSRLTKHYHLLGNGATIMRIAMVFTIFPWNTAVLFASSGPSEI